MRLDRQEDIEIAGGPPRRPASPSPARRMRVPSSTPAGMLTDSVRSLITRPAPRAGAARVVDDLAAALAEWTGALDGEEALARPHLAERRRRSGRSPAVVPGLAPVAGAGLAGDAGRHADLRGLAGVGLGEA